MKEILEYIENHGVAIVISGVVIYFLVLYGRLGVEYIKDRMKKSGSPKYEKAMDYVLKITPEVKGILREILLRLHCSRAYIFLFHNGTSGFGGYPFAYMSCKHEVLSGTANSQYHARQNMPFELYDTLAAAIINNEIVVMDPSIKTSDFDDMIYQTMEKRGNTLTICTKLVDEHQRVIGFVGVDYCKDDKFMFNQEAIEDMGKILFKNAQVLSTLLYVKAERVSN